ncbi:hypothetical protein [Synechococcus sp. UW140]|uniref:hypothetical protein n=1 Tax=Synechococcus sp. UW140 TaxID=368503 RepID=UPI001482621C|nr:hypothetical protein [Synechococcus sp. UW140]
MDIDFASNWKEFLPFVSPVYLPLLKASETPKYFFFASCGYFVGWLSGCWMIDLKN